MQDYRGPSKQPESHVLHDLPREKNPRWSAVNLPHGSTQRHWYAHQSGLLKLHVSESFGLCRHHQQKTVVDRLITQNLDWTHGAASSLWCSVLALNQILLQSLNYSAATTPPKAEHE